ncbi:MAG: TSUP family transporter [Firmicutes bacterium]|nr:TSUP family transporter [Bacillota bacterium]
MHVFLPIANMNVPIILILGLGGAVGFLSGLFGVGGGFLLTPMLMMAGVPPAIATAVPDLSRVCSLYHSSWQRQILNPLSKGRDRTGNLMVPSRIH